MHDKIDLSINVCLNKCVLNHETSLFDSILFKEIDIRNLKFKYDKFDLKKIAHDEFVFDLGDNIILRPLKLGDFERGYLQLLEQVYCSL